MPVRIATKQLSRGLQTTLEELPKEGVVEVAREIGNVERAARGVCCRVGCPGWPEFSPCHALLLLQQSAEPSEPPATGPTSGGWRMKSAYFNGGVEQLYTL